jgi:hypothetical protein
MRCSTVALTRTGMGALVAVERVSYHQVDTQRLSGALAAQAAQAAQGIAEAAASPARVTRLLTRKGLVPPAGRKIQIFCEKEKAPCCRRRIGPLPCANA